MDKTQQLLKNDAFRYFLFALFILATRLPFLSDGYGVDSDAWGVALAAKSIAETGQYEVSRFPGYPVQEIVLSFFADKGPLTFNLLTALMSTMGIVFFAMTLRKLRFRYVFLAATALAFVPTLFINSTNTIDYLWAFAFLMAGMHFIVTKKPITAGIMMGLAIGCRLTSGAMILPYAIMLLGSDYSRRNILRMALFAGVALAAGAVCFLPVFLKYGISFFTYYNVPYPSIPKVLYKFTLETWGMLGFFGLLCGLAMLFAPSRHKARQYLFPRRVNINYVLPWIIAIDLYIISFIVLPMESGYLIPLIPFVILLLGKYLFDKAFIFFALTLIFSPFVGGISPVDRQDAAHKEVDRRYISVSGERLDFDPFTGPLIIYQQRREHAQEFMEKVMLMADTLKANSVIVSGRWSNQVNLLWKNTICCAVSFVPYISHDDLHLALDQGTRIYYLPEADYYNLLRAGFNLSDDGGMPFVKQ